MSNIVQSEKHAPCGYMDMLGINGYKDAKNVICLTANGDNNFIDDGIVKGSLLFVDTGAKFKKEQLNVFKYDANISPQYKLSKTKIAGASFIGKVLMAVNQY